MDNVIDWKARFEEVRAIAEEREADFLAEWVDGLNSNFKYKLRCIKHDYLWIADYTHIIFRGCWCNKCGRESANKNNTKDNSARMELAHATALKHNGFCLESDYKGYNAKMLWKCSDSSHPEFFATYTNVVVQEPGRWCPHCAVVSRGLKRSAKNISTEEKVRIILEVGLGFKLPSLRPDWNRAPLKNYSHPLELDGYNEFFNLAFEFDGYQHSVLSNHFYGSDSPKKALAEQKYRGYVKEQNCARRGVLLVRIPALEPNQMKKDSVLIAHVQECCQRSGLLLNPSDERVERIKQRINNK